MNKLNLLVKEINISLKFGIIKALRANEHYKSSAFRVVLEELGTLHLCTNVPQQQAQKRET